ncbi:3-hydroxybutyryl-CoA dehydrogenase [Gordonia paraffinivorans]|uniref:3-hydroxybutyryl-CoA dehydrogenase n=2 Tax=Gordonia paraffinivorans TaxID=175628 RepID=A0ABQ0IKN2_9ACTN|nr:3-hydroxybutyryl-CoA dehydrogenase [Gordonia paraffinivorans]MBY4573402.1 3-hydroxybutyryl-CoA dehydrogenase [Gordonia paraffinivorans]MCD2145078.1 3-hydroxybutyryl-CoA dehydrogenase [Gordonia paraffinivorans]PWD42836.1 3-hydroxybutyryl-CoA dehydrogenase [Gordonia paraffinivorans]VFA88373.1 3-hydroxybutyryl-CoA dehydrogenase [Gordonia paraffinivorans]GAC84135.1 3-hydroxybutyryl-CoA dehydrogenase [Gordonia paraffinivorans NBRC 108238]
MQKIGVIGGGTMGAGIAEVCAKSGSDVVVIEVKQEFADAARARIEKSLGRAVSKNKLSQEDADAALGRLRVSLDYADLADRDLVIEAAPENEQLKRDIFARLDEAVGENTILATNTSSIPIIKVATATKRPERVVGVHFFNPVPVMPLVEIISTLVTDPQVADAVAGYVKDTLGKNPVRAGDRSGFIVNALLIPYLCQAIRMYDSGYASAEDIDTAMKGGCGYPMGPLTLIDTIGLDITLAAAESLYAEFAEPHFAPPALLRRMVDAGHLGKKSGRGFYTYS